MFIILALVIGFCVGIFTGWFIVGAAMFEKSKTHDLIKGEWVERR